MNILELNQGRLAALRYDENFHFDVEIRFLLILENVRKNVYVIIFLNLKRNLKIYIKMSIYFDEKK
jgi:hypothetical protein